MSRISTTALAGLLILPLTTGCSVLKGPSSILTGQKGTSHPPMHSVVDRNGLDIIIEDASKKATILKDPSTNERYCRAPDPDFATGQSNSMSLGVGTGPSVGMSSGETDDSLGGRTPVVLLTRELMYRACELSLNLNSDTALTKEIYWKFLQTVDLAVKVQTVAAESDKKPSHTPDAHAEIPHLPPEQAGPRPPFPPAGPNLPRIGGNPERPGTSIPSAPPRR